MRSADSAGREHVLKTVRTKLKAAGKDAEVREEELLAQAGCFFGAEFIALGFGAVMPTNLQSVAEKDLLSIPQRVGRDLRPIHRPHLPGGSPRRPHRFG